MESGLRRENARLGKELEDAQLDLDDARKSRRDLQMQLNLANARIGQSTADCESMRVGCVNICGSFLLIDGRTGIRTLQCSLMETA